MSCLDRPASSQRSHQQVRESSSLTARDRLGQQGITLAVRCRQLLDELLDIRKDEFALPRMHEQLTMVVHVPPLGVAAEFRTLPRSNATGKSLEIADKAPLNSQRQGRHRPARRPGEISPRLLAVIS
jgi:hypothetical protein